MVLGTAAPYLLIPATALPWVAATATEPPTGLTAYIVGGGATMVLATALAEVMRRMLNGTLISKATRESELEMNAAILAGAQREDAYMKLAIENRERADRAEQRAEKVAADLAVITKAHSSQVVDALHEQTLALRDLRDDLRRRDT